VHRALLQHLALLAQGGMTWKRKIGLGLLSSRARGDMAEFCLELGSSLQVLKGCKYQFRVLFVVVLFLLMHF